MSVAKVVEIIAQSPKGFEDAIQEGIRRAIKTVEQVKSAWVRDLAGRGGKRAHYLVSGQSQSHLSPERVDRALVLVS